MKQLKIIDLRDILEIFFGLILGLLIFLGASELWQIGAVISDSLVVLLIIINILMLYGMTHFISGKFHKGALFIESIKYPVRRTIVVYVIGVLLSLIIMYWLESVNVLPSFVEIMPEGFFPLYVRTGVFANLFATLFAVTIDLSIVE